jgi:hypothetical protein
VIQPQTARVVTSKFEVAGKEHIPIHKRAAVELEKRNKKI